MGGLYPPPRLAIGLLTVALPLLSGCITIEHQGSTTPLPQRPPELLKYYQPAPVAPHKSATYQLQKRSPIAGSPSAERIVLESQAGPITITLYRSAKPSDDLILVYPILSGPRYVSDHFAAHFARKGFDAAIIERTEEFKEPKNFHNLEQQLRKVIMRDRIALDFFESELGKKTFGAFGISRGAINALGTAGVDARLQYNVFALGAADIPTVMATSPTGKISRYRNAVMQQYNLTPVSFRDNLSAQLKTNPRNVTPYIDPANTLIMLAMFDSTVPFDQGQQMREMIGRPKTVYLPADHFTAGLFSQIISLRAPEADSGIFPFDYIEGEALGFFRAKFRDDYRSRPLPALLQAPLSLIGNFIAQWSSTPQDAPLQYYP